MKKKILICGADALVARHLIRKLKQNNSLNNKY